MPETYVIPESHKELLQAILRELILVRDPDAEFAKPDPEPEPEPKVATIGA